MIIIAVRPALLNSFVLVYFIYSLVTSDKMWNLCFLQLALAQKKCLGVITRANELERITYIYVYLPQGGEF